MPDSQFSFRSARELNKSLIGPFVADVFGRDVDNFWWRNSEFATARAAIDLSNGRMAGLCVGVPSDWMLGDTEVHAVSICGWYVHPDYAGRGLGKELVRSFDDEAVGINALSISVAAIRNFTQLGWKGPWRSHLRLLPLPGLRGGRRPSGYSVRSFTVSGAALPDDLAAALDRIDAERPAGQLRRRRRSDDWRQLLAARITRAPRFHVLSDAAGVPFAYWMLRATDDEAGRQYRATRLHYVSDLVSNRTDAGSLSIVFGALARSAPLTAGALLLCVSDKAFADAARTAGWLHEGSRWIGPKLANKAPQCMLGAALAAHPPEAFHLTFADSDVDLNI